MKKNLRPGVSLHRSIGKALLLMKLSFLLVLAGVLNASAKANGQETVSIHADKMEIGRVLHNIERQGVYRFLYNSRLKDVREKISLNLDGTALPEALKKVFAGTDLTFRILDNNLVVVLSSTLSNQDVTITGKVTGENGDALPNVTVTVKGTSRGASSDNNGNYTITVPDGGTLVFSYIGYNNQELAVGTQTVINVKLVASQTKMDEVVVIGYGQASKRDLTGSIVKIEGKEISDKPNTNPVASLQSKVAGLYVVNNGTPGQQPDVRIRGTVSIGQVHPLYVVDGIFQDNIDYINPNDIESMEVLKDPSSLAIFGVKGATGVITVTTKKAKAGQTVINFSTTYGIKNLVDKIKFVNGEQFKTLYAEEAANNGINTPFDYTGLTANTDWIDAVTQTGHYNTNNLSISGGTDRNKVNFGMGYTRDEGIIQHETLKRLLLSFNDEFKISKNIKIGLNWYGSRQDNPYDVTSGGADILNKARQVVPLVSAKPRSFYVKDPYSPDSLNMNIYSGLNVGLQTSGVVNPLLQLQNEYNKTKNVEYRNVGSFYGEVNFLKYFTARATYYADISTTNKRQYTPLYYAYNPVNDLPYIYSQTTKVQEDDNTYRKFQQDYVLTFKKAFGEHTVTATAGYTTYYYGAFTRTGVGAQGKDSSSLPIPNDPRFWYVTNGFQAQNATTATSSQNEYSTASALARVLYNFRDKYYLNASFRRDGSSQISPDNRYQNFWALGAAWELTKEKFMQTQKVIDFLKIKGSIGVLGNQSAYNSSDGTPLNYPFYPLLNTGNTSTAVFGTNVYTAADQKYLVDPNLKWESVHAYEGGFELSAFQNRLHVEANYFSKTTDNLMTYIDNGPLGLRDRLTNAGSLRNWGEEIAANWNQNISKDFSIAIGGNITFLNNKVISLSKDLANGQIIRASENNGTAISLTQPGEPIGYFYGYEVAGLYQSYNDILSSPNASALGAYRPGDFKFKDVHGAGGKGGADGAITTDDRTRIGNPTPKFTYGSSVNVTWKGLSLGIDVGGVYGNSIFRTWGSLESPFQRVNYSADKLNRWNGAGTSNWVPILSQQDRFNYVGSTYNIEDGSYFRLRNVQLGYSFPHNMLNRANVKDLRVFVNLQNPKTWKHNSGYTPEFGGDATQFGYDHGDGAIPAVSTVGLNLTF